MKKIIFAGITIVFFSCAIGFANAYEYSHATPKFAKSGTCSCTECTCPNCGCADCGQGCCEKDCSRECCKK